MGILNKISKQIKDFKRKRFIKKEFFKNHQHNKTLKTKRDLLKNAIFVASNVVEKEQAEIKLINEQHDDEQLLNKLKNMINIHYRDKVETLTKDNEILGKEIEVTLSKLAKYKKIK